MGFRCEPELPISSSLDISDLTLSGREAGVALAEGAGAQSTPRAHLGGADAGLGWSQHVCVMVRAT